MFFKCFMEFILSRRIPIETYSIVDAISLEQRRSCCAAERIFRAAISQDDEMVGKSPQTPSNPFPTIIYGDIDVILQKSERKLNNFAQKRKIGFNCTWWTVQTSSMQCSYSILTRLYAPSNIDLRVNRWIEIDKLLLVANHQNFWIFDEQTMPCPSIL